MKILLRILKLATPYWKMIIVAVITSLLYVAFNGGSIWLTASFVKIIMPEHNTISVVQNNLNELSSDQNINSKIKTLTQSYIQGNSKQETLQRLCVLIFLLFFMKNIFLYLKSISFGYIQLRTITDLRNKFYSNLHNLSLSFYDKKRPGEISSILLYDISNVRKSLSVIFNQALVEPINILTFIILLFIISWKLTLATLMILPISGLLMHMIGKSIRRKSIRSSKKMAGISSILNETVQGIRIVKAFSMEKFETKKFYIETIKFYKLLFRRLKLRRIASPVNEIFAVGIGIILLYFGGNRVLKGTGMNADDFFRYVFFVFAMLDPIKKLNRINIIIQKGIASASRVFSITDEISEIKEKHDAETIKTFDNEICYQNVRFKYDTSLNDILSNINLTISKGEIIALVGHSGAGKSTLADLLPRFYDPIAGGIFIDGVNINNFTLKSLRQLMGIVTQETILFNDTIENNIAYGLDKIDKKQIIEAARIANAFEFINELPQKFQTIVGDKGSRLSGGQRQRIAIARAILKNPPILILDEATSSLDSESESKVQNAIEHLMKNRTAIVIAHRLSTIQNASKIAVMDSGKIIEFGNHSELMALNGTYKKLYNTQFSSK